MNPVAPTRCISVLGAAMLFAATAPPLSAQLPERPRNLQVLPKDLSTDSVFNLMLGVANDLGVTCGFCHPGGDNPTWATTNFTGDVKPTKLIARDMFRLVNRLNQEMIPGIVKGHTPAPVTCATCHRGAPRPITIEDTLNTLLSAQGTDSAMAAYLRLRDKYTGRMTYDLTDWPLREIAGTFAAQKRTADAVKLLELDARLFPASTSVAFQLGRTYEAAGDTVHAVMQYHKVLSITPGNESAQRRLKALTAVP